MEILAPAGSKEAFLAAINNGADAVYLSGKNFGARAYAANFSLEELAWAVDYAHLRQVKVYVTVNTLIADFELQSALDFCVDLFNLGADGIIVQDWGLLALLGQNYPQIKLNGSTQMVFHNSLGCEAGASWGLGRIILAREVELGEVKAINAYLATAGLALETEIFVHGALCICYSGQCLFSSLVGGRSGNRGRCAQPCRLKYELIGTPKKGLAKTLAKAHLLSPKDLKGYDLLAEIANAGVASAKIEGRMKRPEYVGIVTSAYARANAQQQRGKDEAAITKTQQQETAIGLEQAFNREFTTGYLEKNQGSQLMSYQRPSNRGTKLGRIGEIKSNSKAIGLKLEANLSLGDGLEVWVTVGGRQGFVPAEIFLEGKVVDFASAGAKVELVGEGLNFANLRVGDRVFKTLDSKLNQTVQETYAREDTLAVDFTLKGEIGQALTLLAATAGAFTTVQADFVVPLANKRGTTAAEIKKQLARLGGSGYYLQTLNIEVDPQGMIPASVLNNLRREAVDRLNKEALAPFRVTSLPKMKLPALSRLKNKHQPKLAVFVDDLANAKAAIEAGGDLIYANALPFRGNPGFSLKDYQSLIKDGVRVYPVLPVIATEKELEFWHNQLEAWVNLGFAGLVGGNPWVFALAKKLKWQGELIGDFALNIFNSYAGEAWVKKGLIRLGVSPELNWQEIKSLVGNWQKEVLAFGNLQMMVSRHCVVGALVGGQTDNKSCSKPCLQEESFALKDEKGFSFPVYQDKFCRSHIFNGHKLCLLEDLFKLTETASTIRLDCRFCQPEETRLITASFHSGLGALANDLPFEAKAAKESLAAKLGLQFTKGHYYRGVTEV